MRIAHGCRPGLSSVESLRTGAEFLTGNRLGRLEVDAHPADLVGQGDEGLEIRHREVIDVNPGEVLHGVDRQRRAAIGVGGVDLALTMTGDVHPGVAGDRHDRDGLPVAADLQDHDRISTLGALRPLGRVGCAGAGVGPQDQDVGGRLLTGRHRLPRCSRGDTGEGIGNGLDTGGQGVSYPQGKAPRGQGQDQEYRQHAEESDPPAPAGTTSGATG